MSNRQEVLVRNLSRARKAHKLISYVGAELGPDFDTGDTLIYLEKLCYRIEQDLQDEIQASNGTRGIAHFLRGEIK